MKIQSQRFKTKHSLVSLALVIAKIVTLNIVILSVKIANQTIFQTLMENYKHVKNVIVHAKSENLLQLAGSTICLNCKKTGGYV